MHIHRYSKWEDAEYVQTWKSGRKIELTAQEKRCRKCNKLKVRKP